MRAWKHQTDHKGRLIAVLYENGKEARRINPHTGRPVAPPKETETE